MRALSRTKYTVFAALFTAAAALAMFTGGPPWMDAVLAAAYVVGNGWLAGQRLFPGEALSWRMLLGALTYLSAITVIGAGVYFLLDLGMAWSAAVLFVLPFTGVLLPRPAAMTESVFMKEDARPGAPPPYLLRIAGLALCATVILLAAYGIGLLDASATELTMRSPWDAVPRAYFVIAFLAALGAFTAAYGGLAKGGPAVFALAAVMGLGTLVAALVYAVGFGFDPFIHQATERAILATGFVEPKPFYYLGQYALVTLLARLLGTGVDGIDVMLVPAASVLAVPVAFWSLRAAFRWPSSVALGAAAGVLLLPLSSLIMTTPQGLANLLMLLTAFLALPAVARGAFPRPVLLLLGLAAAAVHPLAGIPLLLFVGILLFLCAYKPGKGAGEVGRRMVLAEIVLIGSIALPIVFILNSFVSPTSVEIDTAALRAPSSVIEQLRPDNDIVSRQFRATFDLVYFWRTVRTWAIFLLGFIGLAALRKERRVATVYGASLLVFAVNYVLLKTLIRFPFLIEYERSNYADRLLDLAVFLVAPMALYAFGLFLIRARASSPALRIGIAVMIAALATSSFYLAYPRRDPYESSRGWSTSASDVETVRSITMDADGADYVALANQAVSAAAIREFGFARYFDSRDPQQPGPIFYYPVPTGGPLYRVFLAMNDAEGNAAAALLAMDLTGADTVYLVVNHYWWKAQGIIVGAQRSADAWWSVNDDDFIFKYTRATVERKLEVQ